MVEFSLANVDLYRASEERLKPCIHRGRDYPGRVHYFGQNMRAQNHKSRKVGKGRNHQAALGTI